MTVTITGGDDKRAGGILEVSLCCSFGLVVNALWRSLREGVGGCKEKIICLRGGATSPSKARFKIRTPGAAACSFIHSLLRIKFPRSGALQTDSENTVQREFSASRAL